MRITPDTNFAPDPTRLKTSACSSICLIAVSAAILSAVFAFRQDTRFAPREPSFSDQIRTLRGVSTLDVAGQENIPEDVDATVLANQAAAYRQDQPVAVRTLENGMAGERIIATAHHQVR
jgi:hypothetical protein